MLYDHFFFFFLPCSAIAFPSLELRKQYSFPSACFCHWHVTLVLCRYNDEVQMLIHHFGKWLFGPSVLVLFLLTLIPCVWFPCWTHHFILIYGAGDQTQGLAHAVPRSPSPSFFDLLLYDLKALWEQFISSLQAWWYSEILPSFWSPRLHNVCQHWDRILKGIK